MAVNTQSINPLTLQLEKLFPATWANPGLIKSHQAVDPKTGNIVRVADSLPTAVAVIGVDTYRPSQKAPRSPGFTTETEMDAILRRITPLQRESIQVKVDLIASFEQQGASAEQVLAARSKELGATVDRLTIERDAKAVWLPNTEVYGQVQKKLVPIADKLRATNFELADLKRSNSAKLIELRQDLQNTVASYSRGIK